MYSIPTWPISHSSISNWNLNCPYTHSPTLALTHLYHAPFGYPHWSSLILTHQHDPTHLLTHRQICLTRTHSSQRNLTHQQVQLTHTHSLVRMYHASQYMPHAREYIPHALKHREKGRRIGLLYVIPAPSLRSRETAYQLICPVRVLTEQDICIDKTHSGGLLGNLYLLFHSSLLVSTILWTCRPSYTCTGVLVHRQGVFFP